MTLLYDLILIVTEEFTMNAQVLMITKMIMFMQEYVMEIEDHAWIELEYLMDGAPGWVDAMVCYEDTGLNNLPYIGIEPAIA